MVALPKIAGQVRCVQTKLGVKVDGEFCVLPMRNDGANWQAVSVLKGQWQVCLPLPAGFQPIGSPTTISLQGRKWLLLPVQLRNFARQ